MAELDSLLLEAAGRTSTPTRKNRTHAYSRWRGEGSGGGSNEDGSDNSKFNKWKHYGSRISLKKSVGGPPEKGEMRNWGNGKDRRFNGDESNSALSIGSDLYKDEADKEEMSKLSELNRELIFATRSTKIDDYRLKKRGRDSSTKVENSEKEFPPPFPSHGHSSVRTEKPAAKIDALNQLRAKRMRQQEPNSYHMLKDSVRVTVPKFDSSDSGSDDGKEDKLSEDNDIDDNLDDLLASKSRPIRYEDVKEITIRRSKLAKWHMEPFFEKIVAGCFVRVGIGMTRNGPKYRLCVVKNVDATNHNRQYEFEGRTTCKWLNCIWGSEASAARWQMIMVSDSPPTEEEFKEWLREMERNGRHIPCLQEVDEKKEEIQKTGTFVYSPKTVKKMIEVKKSSSSRPINVAVQKILLKASIETAESDGKESEADRLRAKLKELEDLSRQIKPADARSFRLLEMNRKNRAENYKKASELKPVDTNLQLGEEGYDPSARKWTKPLLHRVIYSNEETTNVGHDTNKPEEAGKEALVAAMEEAKDEGKLTDTRPPVDYGEELMALHNFDLPISLAALNKFGGAEGVHDGLMARKRKIEATIGHTVSDKYGKSNAFTLSISDYKRRRGFLLGT
ncbi:hypothetical protein IEQ34_006577 [Dendrobium chrysotoxum]|uniref:Plus3 domain-containing protein n=1 Tax=Dendrobium chrysotoxum TaxID=161865 RepID=A0AAV7H5K1_DENCH|nr:hypothetical protein IEQ34_006577 [Dendrobium chrysotoxum]